MNLKISSNVGTHKMFYILKAISNNVDFNKTPESILSITVNDLCQIYTIKSGRYCDKHDINILQGVV